MLVLAIEVFKLEVAVEVLQEFFKQKLVVKLVLNVLRHLFKQFEISLKYDCLVRVFVPLVPEKVFDTHL